MVELEEVDLTKALSMLGHRLRWLARDIFLEKDSPQQLAAMVGLLDEASRQLRERAGLSPRAIEGANPLLIDPPQEPLSNSGP